MNICCKLLKYNVSLNTHSYLAYNEVFFYEIKKNKYKIEYIERGFIRLDNNTLYIVFRASHTIYDILYDIDCRKINNIHKGFYTALQNCKKSMYDSIFNLLHKFNICSHSINIIFIGHSLGATQAVLAAIDMFENYYEKFKNVEIYSFCCPKIGNKKFNKYFKQICSYYKFINIINKNDIINYAPPKIFNFSSIRFNTIIVNDKIHKHCIYKDFI